MQRPSFPSSFTHQQAYNLQFEMQASEVQRKMKEPFPATGTYICKRQTYLLSGPSFQKFANLSYLSITSTSEFKLFTLKFSRDMCVYKYTYIFLLIHTHTHTEWLFDFIVKSQTSAQKRQDTGVRIHWVLSIFEWRKVTAFLWNIYLCWCSLRIWAQSLICALYSYKVLLTEFAVSNILLWSICVRDMVSLC